MFDALARNYFRIRIQFWNCLFDHFYNCNIEIPTYALQLIPWSISTLDPRGTSTIQGLSVKLNYSLFSSSWQAKSDLLMLYLNIY